MCRVSTRYVRAFAERSAATRARLPMLADVAYGPWPEETLDLFFPAPDVASGAVHMFVHGGYWRMFSKNDFSFVAETVTRAGAIAVIIDYALMPAVRMDVIVNQVRRAKSWIGAHIAEVWRRSLPAHRQRAFRGRAFMLAADGGVRGTHRRRGGLPVERAL